MSTRERLSKLRNEIDELLSEVEKKPEINTVLNRIDQIESKLEKINSMEELLKSKTETESAVRTNEILEKFEGMDYKITSIGEEISSLKKDFTTEVTSLRKQVGNIIEAIIDLVKTIAPEIIKPEKTVPLEPLQKIAEKKGLTETKEVEQPLLEETEKATTFETISESEIIEEEEPPDEQTPTILTQLEESEIPERLEEKPIISELPEVETEELREEEEVREESELDSFLSEEDEKLLKELGLDMIDTVAEEKFKFLEEEKTPKYVQLTNLETRKLKLEREINNLKTMIQAGFGSLEDEKKLEEKIREKEEIEIKIREIEGSK